jgi:ornithine cyclodeaminase/alanine dehydrogenase-like protein (mu-crystallin family)
MHTIVTHDSGGLRVLSKQDLAAVDYSLAEVLRSVEGAYRAFAAGLSANPRKLSTKPADERSVAYAMLGRDGERDTVAIKTSYKFDADHDKATQKYYTSLLLYDDSTGLPIALMDCSLVGALRTPAASALIARACAPAEARTALVVGCGTQGQTALPFLAEAMPQLSRLIIHGHHAEGVAAALANMRRFHPGRQVEVSSDLAASARAADIVVGAAGPHSPALVRAAWLKPDALSILVGYGLHAELLHGADYRVATSAEQMRMTGVDLADARGALPEVDAELPAILAGQRSGRAEGGHGRVFAYNSGMVITDIALGRLFAERARAQGLGHVVQLW